MEPSSVATSASRSSVAPGRARRLGSRAAPARLRARPARSPAARSRRRRRRAAAHDRRAARRSRCRADRGSTAPPPRASSHSRSVPGPTSSSMKWSSRVSNGARSTENARGRNGRSRRLRPNARPSRACRTDRPAGGGRRVGAAQHEVGAVALARGDRDLRTPAAPTGRRRRWRRGGRGHVAVVVAGGRRRGSRVQVLQRDHARLAAAAGGDRPGRRHRPGDRRDARDAAGDRGSADLVAIRAGARGRRGVDHEVDVAPLDPVDHVRRAILSLLIGVAGMLIRRIACAVPRVAMIRKPRSCSIVPSPIAAGLSPSATVRNAVPVLGQLGAGGRLGLRERGREVAARSPSPRRWSASRGRAACRRRRSGRTAAPPP